MWSEVVSWFAFMSVEINMWLSNGQYYYHGHKSCLSSVYQLILKFGLWNKDNIFQCDPSLNDCELFNFFMCSRPVAKRWSCFVWDWYESSLRANVQSWNSAVALWTATSCIWLFTRNRSTIPGQSIFMVTIGGMLYHGSACG
jgi:hypothetical protein